MTMKGRDRNRPCWCGSGQKYKHCHLNRESQDAPTIWDARGDFNALHKIKKCMHPNAGENNCKGPIVSAHTVRRAADLAVIARKNHVYQSSGEIGDLVRAKGKIEPKLVGVNQGSTFFGFCSYHDSHTFSPIENSELVPTHEQAFLLVYRPLCKELYLKERHLESLEIMRSADKGKSALAQQHLQEFIHLTTLGISSSLRDLRSHKARFDHDLINGDFSNIRFVAIHLNQPPDLMCSGFLQPNCTFDGRVIQDLSDLDLEMQAIGFSLSATKTGGVATYAWRSESDPASSQLVDSLLRLSEEDIPHALVRYAISELENTYYRPEWWEKLDDKARDAMLDRMAHWVGHGNLPDPRYLQDDGCRAVSWRVTRIVDSRLS